MELKKYSKMLKYCSILFVYSIYSYFLATVCQMFPYA